MASLAPREVVEVVGLGLRQKAGDERVIIEVVQPVLFAEVAASDAVDEIGSHVLRVQVELREPRGGSRCG